MGHCGSVGLPLGTVLKKNRFVHERVGYEEETKVLKGRNVALDLLDMRRYTGVENSLPISCICAEHLNKGEQNERERNRLAAS